MIPSARFPCSSVCFYKDFIIGGFATGHIRVFSAATGALCIEACAHGRWISAMDISVDSGLVRGVFLICNILFLKYGLFQSGVKGKAIWGHTLPEHILVSAA